jgi:hypothetical protein
MSNGVILRVEDNAADVELALRSFQEHRVADRRNARCHKPTAGTPAIERRAFCPIYRCAL